MHTIFQIKNQNARHFIDSIKHFTKGEKAFSITVDSNECKQPRNEAALKEFWEHKKNNPAFPISSDLDFNSIVDEVNL